MQIVGDHLLSGVLAEVAAECEGQDERWSEQNHPDGTGGEWYERRAAQAHRDFQLAGDDPDIGSRWALILEEEVYEALAETDPVKLRAELVQVAVVAVAWAGAIDRRTADKEES
ncbi:hypothetical protein C1I98_11130 [Spongiactinospora gelatinilytica]|uniref:Uncharacterized protein n=2 Tax=Spongiactinospora gelatinilytica TaxID=2666298 RepID=A0A2W2HJM6_9ACTN|nr:hypothetical protein C1I98_11130 [Spongiactinospora gelatinilytica]